MKTIRLFLVMGILTVLSFLQHPAFVKAEEANPLNSLQIFCNEVVKIHATEQEGFVLIKQLDSMREQWKEIISSDETREKGVDILINTIQTCEQRTSAKKYAPFYIYQMLAQSKSSKALDFLLHEASVTRETTSRSQAREYLGDTGDEQAFAFLCEASKGDTGLWSEQTATVKGLRKFGDRGVDIIIVMIENKDLDKWGTKDSKNIWLFELGKSGSNKAALYLISVLDKEPADSKRASTIIGSLMMLSRYDIDRAATIENFLAVYKNRPDLSEENRERAEMELAEVQRIKGKMEKAAKAK